MTAPNVPDSIILQGVFGKEVNKLYPDFSKAKLSGNSSIYFLYDVENLSRGRTPKNVKRVESTSLEEIGFTLRSFKGHSKEGLILFGSFNYGGTSQGYINSVDDITDKFPVGSYSETRGRGVSSFIVISGMWELCTQVQGVNPITIDGKTQFGPGTNVSFHTSGNKEANDIIKSIKRVYAPVPVPVPVPISNAPDSIILRGITIKSYNDQANRIEQDFSEAKLSGNRSIYFLYDVGNLSYGHTPEFVKMVESTSFEDIGFTPRSLRGHYKEGLILFSTFNYGGNSQSFVDNVDDITNMFPLGYSEHGVSSFRVISGKWELCTQVQGVSPIVIDGKTQFGPGTNVSFDTSGELGANNIIKSVKRVSAV